MINASFKFLIKVPTQKAKFNLYENQVYLANLKSLLNQYSDTASKLSRKNLLYHFFPFSYT